MDLLSIDQLFLGSINILDFTNNQTIGLRAPLSGIEVVKFVFLDFLGLFDFCWQFRNHILFSIRSIKEIIFFSINDLHFDLRNRNLFIFFIDIWMRYDILN